MAELRMYYTGYCEICGHYLQDHLNDMILDRSICNSVGLDDDRCECREFKSNLDFLLFGSDGVITWLR